MGPRFRGDDEVNNAQHTLSQTGSKAGGREACVCENVNHEKVDSKESTAEAGCEEIRETGISQGLETQTRRRG